MEDTHTHTRWCEDTQRRWFSRSQRWNSLEEMNQATLGSWPSSLQHGKMVHFHTEATQYVTPFFCRLKHVHVPPTHPSREALLEKATQSDRSLRLYTALTKCVVSLPSCYHPDNRPSHSLSDYFWHLAISSSSKYTYILLPVLSQWHRHSASQPCKGWCGVPSASSPTSTTPNACPSSHHLTPPS